MLELDADAVESETDKLMDATSAIDEQTTITPSPAIRVWADHAIGLTVLT